jgi:hypothetical protein
VEEFMGRSATAPIEIIHAVLDRAEHEIQDLGRGRRVFPFTRVRVHVLAAAGDKAGRARVVAVLEGPPSLTDRLADRLRAAGCAAGAIAADIVFARRRGPDWSDPEFHVEFDRMEPQPTAAAPAAAAQEPPRIKLSVIKGAGEQRAYTFTGGRIDLGRRAEVVDQRQRLIRTNHVAFTEDGPDANQSVSRKHAHVEFNAADRCYRLHDDRSAHGTTIVRAGRTIKVPAGARGTKLENGDEIALGHARLRVTIDK